MQKYYLILLILLFYCFSFGQVDGPIKIKIYTHFVYTDPNNIGMLEGALESYVDDMKDYFTFTYERVEGPVSTYNHPDIDTDISIRHLNPDNPDLIAWPNTIASLFAVYDDIIQENPHEDAIDVYLVELQGQKSGYAGAPIPTKVSFNLTQLGHSRRPGFGP